MLQNKVCTKCKEEKPATEFNRLKDGFQSWCKECKKKNHLENKDRINLERREQWRKSHPLEYIEEGYKKCCKCNEIKPMDSEYFGKQSNSKDGFKHRCKACRTNEYMQNQKHNIQRSRNQYNGNKDYIAIRNKTYKEERKEWYKEKDRIYYENNKEIIKSNVKHYRRERSKVDVGFRLIARYRTRIYKALKGILKTEKTKDLVGCSIEKLKLYIESMFIEGMSWNNYGEWHIDHIKPCSKFDFNNKKEIHECFHYSNMQPLWAKDNLKKSAKFIETST